MATDKLHKGFEKPVVDEAYLMNLMSGDKSEVKNDQAGQMHAAKENKPKEKGKVSSKRMDYEDTFLINRYPAGRNGKVVYIRPEFHERLLRIVQLAREDKTTLYSYIDNILEHHFKEFGADITEYFNDKYKPIL